MSILTVYRPNFCSACGAKIVRLRWRVWTSRRFCDLCSKEFRKQQWLQPAIVAGILLLLGFMFARALRTSPPPLLIQRNVLSGNPQEAPQAGLPTVSEEVYICGARTKKGTPCSRRVHGQVRCWQHKGMPAVLPIEKLRIKD